VGKGLRSAPRDALLVAVTSRESRGWAFGFHRAMDHAGAMLGSIGASVLLALGLSSKQVFMVAGIPGIFAVLAILLGVKEAKAPDATRSSPTQRSFSWAGQPAELKRYMGVLAVFSLANSSDAFLLLKARDVGIPLTLAPILWLILHVTKAATNLVGGRLSDRIGPRRVIGMGWLVYGIIYLLFGWSFSPWQVWTLFALYGLYFGFTEGAEKSLVSEYADPSRKGGAFGLYHTVTGLLALPASLWMGLVWDRWGSSSALIACGAIAFIALLLFRSVCRPPATVT
jgi:MFS family permease